MGGGPVRIAPRIHALCGDRSAQRTMREAVAAAVGGCRRDRAIAPVLAALEAYGAGADLGDCPALEALFSVPGSARETIAPFIARLVALQRNDPLVQLAFRHQSGGDFHFLQIAAKGRATLGLALHDRRCQRGAGGIATFPHAERHEVVLAGRAELGLLEIAHDGVAEATIIERRRRVAVGSVLAFTGAGRSRIVRRVDGRLLVLRLARIAEAPLPTRQFALPAGRLVHRASGDRCESRHEMMLALLGRMRRADAAPAMAAMTRAGSDHLRWQALRECLALDTAEGFRALARIAADRTDPLAAKAGALRATLLEAHPELVRLEHAPCPA